MCRISLEPVNNDNVFFRALIIMSALCLCSGALSQTLFSTGFEAVDGYTSSGAELLSDHGWSANSSWQVPATSDAFAHSGARSAMYSPIPGATNNAFQSAVVTPGSGTVVLTAWVAMLGRAGNTDASTSVGLSLVGTSDIASMATRSDGQFSVVTTTGGSGPFHHSFALDTWHRFDIRADFGSQTATFYVDGDQLWTQSFSASVVTGLRLFSGTSQTDAGYVTRYDDVSLSAVPEPIGLLSLGAGFWMAISRGKRRPKRFLRTRSGEVG